MTMVLIIVLGYAKLDFNCTFDLAIKNGINCSPLIGSICMCLSVILTFIVSLFTKTPSNETIQKAFEVKE